MKDNYSNNIEATHLDYKEKLETKKAKSWLKSVSAFANTKGGCILFGFEDAAHTAVGLDDAQADASKIAELISGRISPRPNYQIESIPAADAHKLCIKLSVQNGPNYPYYYVHEQTRECYVRRGDRSEIANDMELNELILKGSRRTYDSLPSPYKLQDVSFTLLGAAFKKETGEDFNLSKDLLSMGLIDLSGMVSYGGVLLCDQGYLKQSKIVCTRWRGLVKGSIDGDAVDDEVFSGMSLIMLLRSAETFIRTHSKNPWSIRGMRREEHSDYPFKAIREVLVNALVHRDYGIVGAEVHVDMYDDRLEISSPGGMINGSRIQDLDLNMVPSMRRNEIVADVFDRLNFMDRRGSGIRRILSSYTEFKEQPVFYSNEFYFVVTLPNRGEAERIRQKSSLSTKKVPLSAKKVPLSAKKVPLSTKKVPLPFDENWSELDKIERNKILVKWVEAHTDGVFRRSNVENLAKLLSNYGFTYSFNREIVSKMFVITVNRASGILRDAVKCGLVRKEKNGVYFFNSD